MYQGKSRETVPEPRLGGLSPNRSTITTHSLTRVETTSTPMGVSQRSLPESVTRGQNTRNTISTRVKNHTPGYPGVEIESTPRGSQRITF